MTKVELFDDTVERLKRRADALGLPVSSLVEDLVDGYLNELCDNLDTAFSQNE